MDNLENKVENTSIHRIFLIPGSTFNFARNEIRRFENSIRYSPYENISAYRAFKALIYSTAISFELVKMGFLYQTGKIIYTIYQAINK